MLIKKEKMKKKKKIEKKKTKKTMDASYHWTDSFLREELATLTCEIKEEGSDKARGAVA